MAKKRARKNTQPSSSMINDRDANDANWKGIDFESQVRSLFCNFVLDC